MDGNDGLSDLEARTGAVPMVEMREGEPAKRGTVLGPVLREAGGGAPVVSATTWSPERDKFVPAFVMAQGDFPAIEKNRTVEVKSRGGGQGYEYDYATLDAYIAGIRPVLKTNGLGFMQYVDGASLVTTLMHTSGQWCSTALAMPPPKFGGPQDFGSWLTYARRYALCSMLGIAAQGEDDDSNAAEGNTIVERDGRPVGPREAVEPFTMTSVGTKTDLNARGRQFESERTACETWDEFVMFVESKPAKEYILALVAAHKSWWTGVEGQDWKGLKERLWDQDRMLRPAGNKHRWWWEDLK